MARRSFGAIRRLPSKRFQASYIGPDGVRHTAPTTYLLRGDAEAWLRDEELLIDRNEWTPTRHRRTPERRTMPTLAEYAAANLNRRTTRARKPLRPSTADLYDKLLRLCILDELGHLHLDDITPAHVARWHDSLPADKPTQNGNAYMLLRSLLSDAEEEELIERNPCRVKGAGKPVPKRAGQALNVAELTVYAMHVRRRYLVPLLVTAWCGLRSGEVRALRRCDVASDGTRIRIERTVTRVGKKGERREWLFGPPKTAAGRRTIAVPPHLVDVLADYVAEWDASHKNPEALLFPALDGVSPINDTVLREAHKAGAEAINRPDLTLHDLRRTGATLASQAGATIKEVMRMLGHTQPGVAMIYQVADDERDLERARRMSELTTGPRVGIEA